MEEFQITNQIVDLVKLIIIPLLYEIARNCRDIKLLLEMSYGKKQEEMKE